MTQQAISIRPFLGSKEYETSRQFYRELGFEETILSKNMSVFKLATLAFYLQDAYVKDWIDNTMVFLEVPDVDAYHADLLKLDLPAKFAGVRLSDVKTLDWGRECFLHDPAGILWHIGQFNR